MSEAQRIPPSDKKIEHRALPPFSGWAGPRAPRMLIIGEAWGEHEAMTRQPFVGQSGMLLWQMLGEAMPQVEPELHAECLRIAYKRGNVWVRPRAEWLEAAGVAYTNVFNLRPMANKIESLCGLHKKELPADYDYPAMGQFGYVQPQYLPELDRLLTEIDVSRPNLIVAAGNSATWATLRSTSIGNIRGAVTYSVSEPPIKVLPIYHPAAILRQWQWRPITVADLIKAHRESDFAELVRPERHIIINPTLMDVLNWRDYMLRGLPAYPRIVACDVETQWGLVKCIGFSNVRNGAIVIPFFDPAKPLDAGLHYWSQQDDFVVRKAIRDVLQNDNIPKLFQNGMYDIQYILRMGIKPLNCLHDTMLLHHSLFPEMRKGLGFLGSIYTNEAAWKLMGRPKADTVKRDE